MAQIVFTSGVFDLLHEGHLRLLSRAKRLGDILVVAVQDDENVTKDKGKPILNLGERISQLTALPFIDKIIVYSQMNIETLKKINPDIFVHGDDWLLQKDRSEVIDYMEKTGIRLVLLPRTTSVSTTTIKSRL